MTVITTEKQFQASHEAITLAVWEAVYQNGLNMDEDERLQTEKGLSERVHNTYADGMSEADWHAAVLAQFPG